MLFVELALIRWSSSNVIYLSYFSNFVLLGSFLGIGIGFLRSTKPRNLFPLAPAALALLVTFVLVFHVEIDRSRSDLLFFGRFERSGLPIWVTLPVVFVVVAAVMALVAEGVGRLFARFPPLVAYRLDIVGSLMGIGAFSLLALLQTPPVGWGLVAAAVFLILLRPRLGAVQVASLIVLVSALGFESASAHTYWSPYYKVEAEPRTGFDHTYISVSVNGIPHQSILPIEVWRRIQPVYFLPYEHASRAIRRVLIIGAGNGVDTAVALANGAQHVDAVEIDPRILALGRTENPDRPYDDPRVATYVQDGRAFLHSTSDRYDLIVFALTDSLTLVSGQSSLRLESFLFTREALKEARGHLRPGGIVAMYNYYRDRWLVDRLGGMLESGFGTQPCFDQVGGAHLSLLMASTDPSALVCPTRWSAQGEEPAPAGDDYPFLYLRDRSVPGFYLGVLALVLMTAVIGVRTAAGPFARMKPYRDLFAMGAAFLLLETKSVVQFALLFGTTWVVNALVFFGILTAVLAAIEVARRIPIRRFGVLYAALGLSLLLAWTVPPETLLALGFAPRFLAAVGLWFTPIFLANLVFAQRFKDVGSSQTAFGANLLGAMVGGVLEYTSMVTGYRALILLVGALYAAAFVLMPRSKALKAEV